MSEYICPHCKKPIHDDEALLCLYCGESLKRGEKHFPHIKILFVIIVLILIVSFILVVIRL